jgi:hypothetical protein
MEEQRLLNLKKQEEESKRLGGLMLMMIHKLKLNSTPRDYSFAGVDLGTVRARILINALGPNTSLYCLSVNRKQIEDEIGAEIGRMMLVNNKIRKIEAEGNKLQGQTARAFAHVLKYNKTLTFLDFENNMLTADKDDDEGMLLFIEALKSNVTLRSLNVANNRLDEKIGKAFLDCLKVNYTLINLEFSFN